MDWDEMLPKKKSQSSVTIGENIEVLSVAELEQRITDLQAEIGRVEAELGKKRAHEAAASALFKR